MSTWCAIDVLAVYFIIIMLLTENDGKCMLGKNGVETFLFLSEIAKFHKQYKETANNTCFMAILQ